MHGFSGTHYEMGVQQGRAARETILRVLKEAGRLRDIRGARPAMLPMPVFLRVAKRRVARVAGGDILGPYPRQAERLRGIADGAGLDLREVLFMQAMELTFRTPSYDLMACTVVGLRAGRAGGGGPVIGKNFDYLGDLGGFQLACRSAPAGRLRTMGFQMAGLPCAVDGMNERGLVLTYNLAQTVERSPSFTPLSMAIQEALETCQDAEEALAFISRARFGGHAAIVGIFDATGGMHALEVTGSHRVAREADGDQLVITNHYLTPEMRRYEIPSGALFRKDADYPGLRILESSERRRARAEELLASGAGAGEARVEAVLRDHGSDGMPSNLTICNHGKSSCTLRSVIFHPGRRVARALHGRPCEVPLEDFALE